MAVVGVQSMFSNAVAGACSLMAVKISSFGLVAMASSRGDMAGMVEACGTARRIVPLAFAFFGLMLTLLLLIQDFCLSFIFFGEGMAA